jgi:diketogulonate reductase-like aldo/keto reductase
LRAIGVSSFRVAHLREFENAAVKPAALQSEYHPFLATKQQEVVDYCAKHKIVFESYMSFGGTQLNHPVRIR